MLSSKILVLFSFELVCASTLWLGQKEATQMTHLRSRRRRGNHLDLFEGWESTQEPNYNRECLEEVCSYEEMREIHKNTKPVMTDANIRSRYQEYTGQPLTRKTTAERRQDQEVIKTVLTKIRSLQSNLKSFRQSKSEPEDIWDTELLKYNETAMNLPLTHYFIKTSHNTYLTGGQLVGSTSADMYRKAIQAGYRVVEVDIYNEDDNLVVKHGPALTGKASLEEVLKVIQKHAFEKTNLPLFISQSNKTPVQYHTKIADMLKSVFGSALLTKPIGKYPEYIPSPKELSGKIVVREKRGKEGTKYYRHPDIQELAIYMTGRKWSDENTASNFMAAIDENKYEELLAEKNGTQNMVKHNLEQLTKVYGHKTRVTSGNYDGVNAWATGAQVVAFNIQHQDTSLMMNEALFKLNGGVGIVPRPVATITGKYPTNRYNLEILAVTELQRHESQSDIIDPFVEIDVYDYHADEPDLDKGITHKWKTRVVKNGGTSSTWFDSRGRTERTEFRACSDTAFVVLKVKDSDAISKNDDIGRVVLPLRAMRYGYSFARIRRRDQDSNFGRIWLKFEKIG